MAIGAFTVFNNGNGRPGNPWSTVDEVVIPYDDERGFLREEGSAFGPVDANWSYAAPDKQSFFSRFVSGVQRLPNGNTLICSGEQAWIFEVTRAGEIVWDYQNEHGWNLEEKSSGRGGRDTRMHPNGLFRATRIPLDHPGLAGKEP